MNISDIQARLGVPASTLAFHLGGLVGVGLVSQEKSRPRGHLPAEAPAARRRDGISPRGMLQGVRRRTGGDAQGKLILAQNKVGSTMDQPIKAAPVHYGWVILAAGTFGSFMTLPGQTAGVSVFFDPITTDLHISRTSASIAYAAGTLAGILPAPVIGRWIDKRGPRLTATIIAGGLALACTCMAFVESAMTLLIGFALLRGMAIGGLSLVSQQVVNLWFVHRRGIAAAAASLGLAAGSMVFPQLIDFLISMYGWRGAYLALAVSRCSDHSSRRGRAVPRPTGKVRPYDGCGTSAGRDQDREEPSFTRKQALRTGVFWLLCAVGFLTNAVGTALLLNHFSIMQTAGIERARRAEGVGALRGRSGRRHARYRGLAGSV